jgi:adenylosuccinate lyase
MNELFDERSRVQGWLEILVFLAEAQAEAGLIPVSAAIEIAEKASMDNVDFDFWAEDYKQSGHSVLGLIRCLAKKMSPAGSDFLFLGATVQDVTDTWTSKVCEKVLIQLTEQIELVTDILMRMSENYKFAVMAGRTHGQSGSPVTFGFKCAVWLAEFERHCERIREVGSRLGVVQFTGSVGSMYSLSGKGSEIQENLARKMKMKVPSVAWTSSRDVFYEFLHLQMMLSSTCAKVGNEIYNLQRTEIGEVSEGLSSNQVGSITMPYKKNPELAEQIGTLARAVRYDVHSLAESLIHEHERDGLSWKLEWLQLPQICTMTAKCMEVTVHLLENLQVHPVRMKENLDRNFGISFSERLLMVLAPRSGISKARAEVQQICETSLREKRHFFEVIRSHPGLSEEEKELVTDPLNSLVGCFHMIERTVQMAQSRKNEK